MLYKCFYSTESYEIFHLISADFKGAAVIVCSNLVSRTISLQVNGPHFRLIELFIICGPVLVKLVSPQTKLL